jgi:hypothetical protein
MTVGLRGPGMSTSLDLVMGRCPARKPMLGGVRNWRSRGGARGGGRWLSWWSSSSPCSTSPACVARGGARGGGRQRPWWSGASPVRSPVGRQPRRKRAVRRPPPEPRRRKCARERRRSENGCQQSMLYLCVARRSTTDNGSVFASSIGDGFGELQCPFRPHFEVCGVR